MKQPWFLWFLALILAVTLIAALVSSFWPKPEPPSPAETAAVDTAARAGETAPVLLDSAAGLAARAGLLAQLLVQAEDREAALVGLLADARNRTDRVIERSTVYRDSVTRDTVRIVVEQERAAADSALAACQSRAVRLNETAALYRASYVAARAAADTALVGLRAARDAYGMAADRANARSAPTAYAGALWTTGGASATVVVPVRLPVVRTRAAVVVTAGACTGAGVALGF